MVDHEVFGLQVPINDALLVQISEGLQGASGAKSGRAVLEGPHLSQHPVQFAAQVRVHQHVHPRLVLERPVAKMVDLDKKKLEIFCYLAYSFLPISF